MTRAMAVLIAGWALLVAVSCAADSSPPPARMVPAAAPGAVVRGHAIEVLAQARCVREQRCGEIGYGKLVPSHSECVGVMRWDAQQTLASCRFDVKGRELYACARAVENQPCGMLANPLEWFARLTSCRAENLCLR
jgi:hypothetical protein